MSTKCFSDLHEAVAQTNRCPSATTGCDVTPPATVETGVFDPQGRFLYLIRAGLAAPRIGLYPAQLKRVALLRANNDTQRQQIRSLSGDGQPLFLLQVWCLQNRLVSRNELRGDMAPKNMTPPPNSIDVLGDQVWCQVLADPWMQDTARAMGADDFAHYVGRLLPVLAVAAAGDDQGAAGWLGDVDHSRAFTLALMSLGLHAALRTIVRTPAQNSVAVSGR